MKKCPFWIPFDFFFVAVDFGFFGFNTGLGLLSWNLCLLSSFDRAFFAIWLVQESLRALHYLNEEFGAKKGASPKKPKKTAAKKYIKPVAENFKRTLNGQFLVRQELTRLLEEQSRVFPAKPMLTVDKTEVRFSDTGKPGVIRLDKLLLVAPKWYSAFFSNIRNKIHYGCKVQASLQSVPLLQISK